MFTKEDNQVLDRILNAKKNLSGICGERAD